MSWTRRPALVVALAATAAVMAGVRPGHCGQVFKVYVEHAGVVEVGYERLAAAGLDGPLPSAGIGLRSFGAPVPVWLEDGGDGFFDPGDRLLFLGEVLRGQESYLDPYSRFNCYVLSFADPEPWRGETRSADGSRTGEPVRLMARHHLEPDRVMVRFRPRSHEPEEIWYWQRLSVADRQPFRQELVLDGLVRGAAPEGRLAEGEIAPVTGGFESTGGPASSTVRLRFGFRGWSEPRHLEARELPHHEVEIRLNGASLGRTSWDGTDHHEHAVEVTSDSFTDGANALELVVPKRLYPDSGDLLVDVVLLNWIELEFEHEPVIDSEQLRLHPAAAEGPVRLEISPLDGGPVELFLPSGTRLRSGGGVFDATLATVDAALSLVRPGAAAAPAEVVWDRPSDLASGGRQADYVMITHRSLEGPLERLAEFHRRRGLTVAVVDVQDIYDEFNFGVVHPRAVKDFLEHAWRAWRPPAPRFVLLVGDASWDFKNTTADDANYADWTYRPGEARFFVKNSSTPYAEAAELNHRNLVPTWSYPTSEGHAASDTWFVCFDDGDKLPDMAIGRVPVVTPEELGGVIDKTIAFAAEPPVGPWRRNLLFIANESASFQARSDQIAERFGRRGYVSTKIYPHPSEPANELHTRRIIEALDAGLQAVHFIGHGGRYIWRTGPPDLSKNHDLFTLEHLDQLAPNRRLPVALSLTCYSAPFDHPTADSIGEKLLRVPGRGAIAVFAASWRNSPSPSMGEALLEELTVPGATIGEAVMRAKHEFHSDMLVQTYNLLGDPALPVAAPGHVLGLELEDRGDVLELRVSSPVAVDAGQLLVDWVAEDGSVLRTDRTAFHGIGASLTAEAASIGPGEAPAAVRAYLWDESAAVDAIGWLATGADDRPDDDDDPDRPDDGAETRRE